MKKLAGSLAALLTTVMLMTGCGGDSDSEPSSGTTSPVTSLDDTNDGTTPSGAPALYDDSEVVQYIGFADTGSGYAETYMPDGAACEALILTGADSVALYADAGDTVATNPDGTVGGKILSESEKSCFELLTQRLSTFPPSDGQTGILTEGPTEASASATIGITQAIFFNEDQYKRACQLSESPAYLAQHAACAEDPRTVGQIYNDETSLWESPTAYEVTTSGSKGTVTFTWDIPAELGPPTTTKYLQHDGTRWFITGDEETGDLGIGIGSSPTAPSEDPPQDQTPGEVAEVYLTAASCNEVEGLTVEDFFGTDGCTESALTSARDAVIENEAVNGNTATVTARIDSGEANERLFVLSLVSDNSNWLINDASLG